ncbi:DAPK2-like protein [Mya arenaria]|uniref:DAPK2-like protein n=1 Tax=Mya arenaria TaxID=6604 RepID=A0ABY7DWY7_MYAAR|nr:DAPK2-like protein [Mya arenaria]
MMMEFKKEPVDLKYELGDDIGKGHFATVKRCRERATGAEYAAKFIRKRRGGGRRGAKLEDIEKEIEILGETSHRNIINLYDVYETNREVILILELVDGGELFEYLSAKDKLCEEEASSFIKQILDGLEHLHSRYIAHLDLKPENILLQEKGSTAVKLIDFGLSRKIGPKEEHRALMGTAEFVAPEVVSFEPLSVASDMWSIGETYHNVTAVNYQFDDEYFSSTSELAKDFIRKLLVKDQRKRATICECQNHPWIKPKEKRQKDLRRSSVINTEHLKRFIARQRWKRSMRIVSMCNRLSRSMQLRRIQSSDTLGSCSEESDSDLDKVLQGTNSQSEGNKKKPSDVDNEIKSDANPKEDVNDVKNKNECTANETVCEVESTPGKSDQTHSVQMEKHSMLGKTRVKRVSMDHIDEEINLSLSENVQESVCVSLPIPDGKSMLNKNIKTIESPSVGYRSNENEHADIKIFAKHYVGSIINSSVKTALQWQTLQDSCEYVASVHKDTTANGKGNINVNVTNPPQHGKDLEANAQEIAVAIPNKQVVTGQFVRSEFQISKTYDPLHVTYFEVQIPSEQWQTHDNICAVDGDIEDNGDTDGESVDEAKVKLQPRSQDSWEKLMRRYKQGAGLEVGNWRQGRGKGKGCDKTALQRDRLEAQRGRCGASSVRARRRFRPCWEMEDCKNQKLDVFEMKVLNNSD